MGGCICLVNLHRVVEMSRPLVASYYEDVNVAGLKRAPMLGTIPPPTMYSNNRHQQFVHVA